MLLTELGFVVFATSEKSGHATHHVCSEFGMLWNQLPFVERQEMLSWRASSLGLLDWRFLIQRGGQRKILSDLPG